MIAARTNCSGCLVSGDGNLDDPGMALVMAGGRRALRSEAVAVAVVLRNAPRQRPYVQRCRLQQRAVAAGSWRAAAAAPLN